MKGSVLEFNQVPTGSPLKDMCYLNLDFCDLWIGKNGRNKIKSKKVYRRKMKITNDLIRPLA